MPTTMENLKSRMAEMKAKRGAGSSAQVIEKYRERMRKLKGQIQSFPQEVRRKGLMEAIREKREERRGSTGTYSSKVQSKDIAIEGSPELKIQKGRIAVEA